LENVPVIDLSPIIQPVLGVCGLVITGLAGVYVPKAIEAFQTRTGIILTGQQQATVLAAVQTAKGVIETELDRGAMAVAHVNVGNAKIQDQANAVLAAVPNAAAAMGMTQAGVARMIVGAVDTATHGPQTVAANLTPVALGAMRS